MTSIIDAPPSDLDGRLAADALTPSRGMMWVLAPREPQADVAKQRAGNAATLSHGGEGRAAWDHAAKFDASGSRLYDFPAICESMGWLVMRLCRFDDRIGVVEGDIVRDVSAVRELLGSHGHPLPSHDLSDRRFASRVRAGFCDGS